MNLDQNNQLTTDITTLRIDHERGYRRWRMEQIYLGQEGKGLFVPNVGDIVDDVVAGVLYEKEVIFVDPSTHIPTLRELRRQNQQDLGVNHFTAVGPGYQSETWRIFYDDRVVPHTLMIDAMLHTYDEKASYIKLFRGRDISSSGRVISQYRTSQTDTYSENVPLYQVGNRFDDSPAVKRPMTFHTTEHLNIGDEVTAVIYSNDGTMYSQHTLLVAYGSVVRDIEESNRYVIGIELVSPFLSPSDDHLIEFHSNIQREGLFTMAKVHYSDGTERKLAIDGSKFSIIGLEHYISTLPHETNSFGLRYQLDDNELAWNASSGLTRHITEIYRYRTLEVDGSYTVKLSVVPHYRSANAGWDLRYFLHNLDRSICIDVTDFVEPGANGVPFNGRKYGVTQYLSVALELSKMNIGVDTFRHVQNLEIALMGPADGNDKPYQISYFNNQPEPYGEVLRVQTSPIQGEPGKYHVNLNQYANIKSLDEFLALTYFAGMPLYDTHTEAKAPAPTHFAVLNADGSLTEYEISQWNQDIIYKEDPQVPFKDGDTLVIHWRNKQDPRVTKELSTSSFIMRF